MDQIFEELFEAWCPAENPRPIPEHLKSNPARAYGLFTFELGLKLGLRLATGTFREEFSDE